jgi:hypothetical protein
MVMPMNWTDINAAAISALIGAVVTGWLKLSKENAVIKSNILTQQKEIDSKAAQSEALEMKQAIAALVAGITDHHKDHRSHRNEDSEKRIQDLIETVKQLVVDNSQAHDSIMKAIGRI